MTSGEEDEESEAATKASAKEVAAPREPEDAPKPKDELFLVNKEKTVRLRDEKNLKVVWFAYHFFPSLFRNDLEKRE
ncbi:unnamed protein product [Toxocara canis]|uniref:Thioredoxin domain-containing protein n=1 Tax=Toxocara canis TaxID=6265 RepID=A0A183U8C9_TOXCA|nr:unnamed protein product [Toxocara canis]